MQNVSINFSEVKVSHRTENLPFVMWQSDRSNLGIKCMTFDKIQDGGLVEVYTLGVVSSLIFCYFVIYSSVKTCDLSGQIALYCFSLCVCSTH